MYPSRFPGLWIHGHILNHSPHMLQLSSAHSTSPPVTQQIQKQKDPHQQQAFRNVGAGPPFDKRWALYFSHQKWNTTLSHSLKSTKANYPSFTQVPIGPENPIYLGPDVSMSQSGDSRPQRGLLTSLWVLWFKCASDSAGWLWCLITAWLLTLLLWHHWLCEATVIQQGSI